MTSCKKRQPRLREKPQTEILLWTTPEEPPRALQASECHELLDPTRASCLILAQRQPGKFNNYPILAYLFNAVKIQLSYGALSNSGISPIKNCKKIHRTNLTGIGVVFN